MEIFSLRGKGLYVYIYMYVYVYIYVALKIMVWRNRGENAGRGRNYGRFVAVSSSEKFIPLERSMTLIAGVEALHWSVSYESGCSSGVGSLTSAFAARGLIDTGIIEIIVASILSERIGKIYPRILRDNKHLVLDIRSIWKLILNLYWSKYKYKYI